MQVYASAPLPGGALASLARDFDVKVERHSFSESRLRQGVKRADALLCLLSHPITEDMLRAAPRLRIAANYAVGYNNIDWKAAKAFGIWVTHTPGVLTAATADLTWALILAASRRLVEADAFMRAGRFRGWGPSLFLGTGLQGKTLGIFGMGRIGRAVAERARAFGMHVAYCSRGRLPVSVEKKLGARRVSLAGLLRKADVLTIHAPLTEQTRGCFGPAQFNRMKKGAVFINTARGEMVDEAALARALASGHLFAAGLDVYEREPAVHPALRRLKNVVLLPHIGSAARETREAMARMACEDVRRVLMGRRPLHPIPEMHRGFKPRPA